MSSLHLYSVESEEVLGVKYANSAAEYSEGELAHRRHTETTVGTTLKGRYRIVQYRIQYVEGDYIHTTLTQ